MFIQLLLNWTDVKNRMAVKFGFGLSYYSLQLATLDGKTLLELNYKCTSPFLSRTSPSGSQEVNRNT